ncbi:MAG: response regulator transcription factor [Pseudonocardiaceae bacterium]
MTPDVTAADLRAVLEFAERTLSVTDHESVQSVLLAGLAELVGADAATLHETDVTGPGQVSWGWPPARLTTDLVERLRGVLLQHPFMPLYARLRPNGPFPGEPFRISDLMSRRQWRDNPVAREVLPEASDQLGVMLGAHNGAMRNVVLTRSGHTFTDHQRDLLSLTLRHVTVAVERASPQPLVGLQIPTQPVQLVSSHPGGATAPVDAALSRRQRQVLAMVAQGWTDAQIASRLHISPRTVSKHLEHIYARLGVPNRAAAVARLTQPGVRPPEYAPLPRSA